MSRTPDPSKTQRGGFKMLSRARIGLTSNYKLSVQCIKCQTVRDAQYSAWVSEKVRCYHCNPRATSAINPGGLSSGEMNIVLIVYPEDNTYKWFNEPLEAVLQRLTLSEFNRIDVDIKVFQSSVGSCDFHQVHPDLNVIRYGTTDPVPFDMAERVAFFKREAAKAEEMLAKGVNQINLERPVDTSAPELNLPPPDAPHFVIPRLDYKWYEMVHNGDFQRDQVEQGNNPPIGVMANIERGETLYGIDYYDQKYTHGGVCDGGRKMYVLLTSLQAEAAAAQALEPTKPPSDRSDLAWLTDDADDAAGNDWGKTPEKKPAKQIAAEKAEEETYKKKYEAMMQWNNHGNMTADYDPEFQVGPVTEYSK